VETYGGGVVAYSLANLTDADVDWQGPKRHFSSQISETERESVLLRLRFTNDSVEVLETVPLWLDDEGNPAPATGERNAKIRAQLEEYSTKLTSTELQQMWESDVIESRVAAPLASWWSNGSLWDKIKGFRPGQLVTLYLLAQTYLRVKLSRSESKWLLVNPHNDTRPMPAAHKTKAQD
jgi:hypothetical protein